MDKLLEYVDEIKNDLPEGQYLQMMNLLKEVNDTLVYEDPQHIGHNSVEENLNYYVLALHGLPQPVVESMQGCSCHRELLYRFILLLEERGNQICDLKETIVQLSIEQRHLLHKINQEELQKTFSNPENDCSSDNDVPLLSEMNG